MLNQIVKCSVVEHKLEGCEPPSPNSSSRSVPVIVVVFSKKMCSLAVSRNKNEGRKFFGEFSVRTGNSSTDFGGIDDTSSPTDQILLGTYTKDVDINCLLLVTQTFLTEDYLRLIIFLL